MVDASRISPQRPVVLASSSPRRRVLLGTLGVRFTVRISDLDEAMTAPSAAADYVESLARQKAEIVAWEAAPVVEHDVTPGPGSTASLPGTLVIGADTVVSLDGEVLGKPADTESAATMLGRLRGRDHEVLTAVALVDAMTGTTESRVVTTVVHMHDFDDVTLQAYIATGEPFDKAGGYGIQRGTRQLVAGFSGCYTNVVGFPLCEVAGLLISASVSLDGGPPFCRLPDGQPCPHEIDMSMRSSSW